MTDAVMKTSAKTNKSTRKKSEKIKVGFFAIIAKIFRVITVPPVMVSALFTILYFARRDIYSSLSQLFISILFLGILPVLAYPAVELFPALKKNRRESERNFAFIFTAVGYIGGAVYALAANLSRDLTFVYFAYLFSAMLLIICNKVIKLRASGHSCSITGPILLLLTLTGWQFIGPCAAVFAGVLWSSLYLKRHTLKEITLGALSAALGMVISLLIFLV